MTRCWIRNAGAAEAAGPFSLEELRALARAGLLPVTATASMTAFEGFRVITAWPELVEALNTPGVRVLRGAAVMRQIERHVITDTAGQESLAPVEKVSSLRLGRQEYEDANNSDKTPVVDAVEILRANRNAEAERPLRFPPWYRAPLFRDLCRYAWCFIPGVALVWFGGKGIADGGFPMAYVGMIGVGGLLLGGGAFFIFFVSPSRWGME